MRPFKQRQYWDTPPWDLSDTMRRAMDLVEMLLEVKPVRRVRVTPDVRPALVVASDAQVEPGDWPGGGVLIHDPLGQKVARHLQFRQGCLTEWGLTLEDIANGKQPIALCEAAMLPLAMIAMPEVFRGRSVVWYVDNTSAMASFVKGASANAHLERIVAIFWMCSFLLKATIWVEWVDSEGNWSDGLSRALAADRFVVDHGFETAEILPEMAWWSEPLLAVWNRLTRLLSEQALGR